MILRSLLVIATPYAFHWGDIGCWLFFFFDECGHDLLCNKQFPPIFPPRTTCTQVRWLRWWRVTLWDIPLFPLPTMVYTCVCCSVLQCVAVCCSVACCIVVKSHSLEHPFVPPPDYGIHTCVAVCCDALQCVAVYCVAVWWRSAPMVIPVCPLPTMGYTRVL